MYKTDKKEQKTAGNIELKYASSFLYIVYIKEWGNEQNRTKERS